MNRLALLLAFLFASCTHWIIDAETRIQVTNKTDVKIHDFSIISEREQVKNLVPEVVQPGSSSKIHEHDLIGEFDFVIFSEGVLYSLGVHKLKKHTVEVQITNEDGQFMMKIK